MGIHATADDSASGSPTTRRAVTRKSKATFWRLSWGRSGRELTRRSATTSPSHPVSSPVAQRALSERLVAIEKPARQAPFPALEQPSARRTNRSAPSLSTTACTTTWRRAAGDASFLGRVAPVHRFLRRRRLSWHANRHADLDLAHRKGATVFRTLVDWSKVAPRRPRRPADPFSPEYRLDDLDELVRNADQRGIRVRLTIWERPAGRTVAPVRVKRRATRATCSWLTRLEADRRRRERRRLLRLQRRAHCERRLCSDRRQHRQRRHRCLVDVRESADQVTAE